MKPSVVISCVPRLGDQPSLVYEVENIGFGSERAWAGRSPAAAAACLAAETSGFFESASSISAARAGSSTGRGQATCARAEADPRTAAPARATSANERKTDTRHLLHRSSAEVSGDGCAWPWPTRPETTARVVSRGRDDQMRRMGVRGGEVSRWVTAESTEMTEAVRGSGHWESTAAGARTAKAAVRPSVRAGATVMAWLEQQAVAGLTREDGIAAAWSWASDAPFGQQSIGSQFAAGVRAHRQAPASCSRSASAAASAADCRATRNSGRRREPGDDASGRAPRRRVSIRAWVAANTSASPAGLSKSRARPPSRGRFQAKWFQRRSLRAADSRVSTSPAQVLRHGGLVTRQRCALSLFLRGLAGTPSRRCLRRCHAREHHPRTVSRSRDTRHARGGLAEPTASGTEPAFFLEQFEKTRGKAVDGAAGSQVAGAPGTERKARKNAGRAPVSANRSPLAASSDRDTRRARRRRRR